jgi:hypothetical protein
MSESTVDRTTDERDQRARLNAQESAYAVAGYQLPNGDLIYGAPGLTKRELFAAMAMQGLLSTLGTLKNVHVKEDGPLNEAVMAAQSVELADALLKELAK